MPKLNRLNDLDPKTWLKFQKSWFIHNPPPRKKGVLLHPAKFPETMAQEFIEFFTKRGECVLDPMAGTGSMLFAALRAGRHSYGIELNPKYAEIARQIIAEEKANLGAQAAGLTAEVITGDAANMAEYMTAYNIPTVDYLLTCYDDQTEILTEDGWIPFPRLREGIKVATLEEEKFLRFREPLLIIKAPYEGQLYRIKTKTIDLMVTPNHNMYVRKQRSSAFQLIPAHQIIGKEVEYKIDAEWEGREQTTFHLPGVSIQWRGRNRIKDFPAREVPMDVWLEFLGYWLTEGSVYPRRYLVDLTTADPRLAERFMGVIKAIGETPKLYQNEQVIHVKFSSPVISAWLAPLGHADQKHIPREFLRLSRGLLRILFDALMAGDGDKVNGRRFWTSSERLKDDFQELLLKIGYAGICQARDRRGQSHAGPQGQIIRTNFLAWCVGIWKERLTPRVSPRYCSKINPRTQAFEEMSEYQGIVYCVQVPSGIIYVRRNGKGVWCGNSPPYWDMLHAKGAETQKKRRARPELDVFYSDDPNDLGNLHDYEEFLAKLVAIYAGLKPLLREKAYLTIIVKNVKKGGKIYPLAWDLGRELGKVYTLKDEKIWCLLPGQKIWTSIGPVPIEEVKVNTSVLTHTGSLEKVIKSMERDYHGHIISIKPSMFNLPLALTPEHEIYAITRRQFKHKDGTVFFEPMQRGFKRGPKWVMAKELNVGDLVAFPIPTTTIDLLELDMKPYLPSPEKWSEDGDFFVTRGRGKQGRGRIPRSIKVEKDFLRLAGWFLSEGSAGVSGIYIANRSEADKQEIYELLTTVFGVNAKIDHNGVWCRSRTLAQVFINLFGKSAHHKKLPDFMWFLPIRKQQHLLRSLWQGDGHLSSQRISYKTVSNSLCDAVVFLSIRMGAIPYVQRNAKWFGIVFRGLHAQRMSNCVGAEIKVSNNRREHSKEKDGIFWMAIRDVITFQYAGKVYNLEVENANTYVTQSFLTHNCQDNQPLAPYGLGSAWVSNTFHHYCLQFRNEEIREPAT